MKKIITIIVPMAIGILLTASVFAQAPQKMSYQAIIRNSSDALVTNTNVGVQISILQGSADGSSVYTERHFPKTNNNGLVTLEISGGTVVSGNFPTIDWGAHTYFIKTETDLKGGANYTITGTSQLLSVPYALYAKTAESITGTVKETDPVFTGSKAANITAKDITNLSNLSGTNTGDQNLSALATTSSVTTALALKVDKEAGKGLSANDYTTAEKTKLGGLNNADGSETKVNAGTSVTITGEGTTKSPYVINASNGATLTIGQSYQGGIIFWLDATGQHGLIAATADQSTGIRWYNDTLRNTGTTGDGLYAGSMNTAMIVATQMADNQTGNFAAKVCADYSVTVGGITYGDWYLPSKYELNLLYLQKDVVGGFGSVKYWTSCEFNTKASYYKEFFGKAGMGNEDKYYSNHVRAVRAF